MLLLPTRSNAFQVEIRWPALPSNAGGSNGTGSSRSDKEDSLNLRFYALDYLVASVLFGLIQGGISNS